ncbi:MULTISPECIES: ISL3 family transposase [unclassified Bifidobacterium]|uniref:ISL3 family transposase n=1 Tax=unclassified Bifidobacterium TaxID=2608897 RepID=UPI002159884E|nr:MULTISPECIES: ISL3 family transposase [unclassified Bifidobacterium]
MKKTARLGNESSAFDGRVLLGLDRLGLAPVWQRHERKGSRAGVWLIGCELENDTARYCTVCGAAGRVRSSWLRRFAHTPIGQHAVHLMVRVRRYECLTCARSWTDDLTRVAAEGRRLTEAAVWWAAAEVVLKSKSILACARDLCCSWDAVNTAVLGKGMESLIDDPARFDGVDTVGVDEHVWRHTRHGNRYVTVIVDLTPRRHDRPARLLDMVEGRSEKAFASWLAERPQTFRDAVKVVAMDAFAGYKKAARHEIPHAVEVLDPFHIVKLAGDKLTAVRCRLQRERTGRRGTKDDPLYKSRRVLLKTETLRTGKQKERAARLLDDPANAALRLAHGAYQKIIRCYAQEDRKRGRGMMAELIEALNARGAAPGCPELATLGRTLKRRMGDVLAFFDWPHSANGPTEAINGRLETLRGIALGFRNLDNYITRSLLHTGGFRQAIQTHL